MTRAGLKDGQAKATAMESRKTAERISLSINRFVRVSGSFQEAALLRKQRDGSTPGGEVAVGLLRESRESDRTYKNDMVGGGERGSEVEEAGRTTVKGMGRRRKVKAEGEGSVLGSKGVTSRPRSKKRREDGPQWGQRNLPQVLQHTQHQTPASEHARLHLLIHISFGCWVGKKWGQVPALLSARAFGWTRPLAAHVNCNLSPSKDHGSRRIVLKAKAGRVRQRRSLSYVLRDALVRPIPSARLLAPIAP